MKNKLKEGMFLIDDCNLTYKVIEVFKNSAVVQAVSKIEGNFSLEIWKILKVI